MKYVVASLGAALVVAVGQWLAHRADSRIAAAREHPAR
jgi:hypothetical protein